jgi:hypothetical protein
MWSSSGRRIGVPSRDGICMRRRIRVDGRKERAQGARSGPVRTSRGRKSRGRCICGRCGWGFTGGRADAVEFHSDAQNAAAKGVPFPVEYKRGKPNKNGADLVQLCAQALCLEELLETTVRKFSGGAGGPPAGAWIETRNRRSPPSGASLSNPALRAIGLRGLLVIGCWLVVAGFGLVGVKSGLRAIRDSNHQTFRGRLTPLRLSSSRAC